MAPASRDRRWWALGTLCLGLLITGVDNSILGIALPTLVRKLGASTADLQWIVEAYSLVFAGLLLLAGSLGDRYGRRGALTFGLCVFGIGSAVATFADTPGQLIAMRAIMGGGAAFILPSTLSIVTNVFTEPKERARAIGVWAGVSGVGIALGPVLGGWLLGRFWWGSIFLVNVPVVVFTLVACRLFVPSSRDLSRRRLDLPAALLSVAGLSALVWAIIEAPERGWTDVGVLRGFLAAAVLLGAFAVRELRTPEPMLDVSFFRNPRFTAASAAVTLVFFALSGSTFLLGQHLQFVLGYSPLAVGVRMMPVAAVLMIAAPLSVRLVEKIGTKLVVASGLAFVAAALALLSRLTVEAGYPRAFAGFLMMGAGMGLAMAPATESIIGSLPRVKAGVGSAVNQTTRQVGAVLGVAVVGSIFSSRYAARIEQVMRFADAPERAITWARSSIGGAFEVARRATPEQGRLLEDFARHAFDDGLRMAMVIGALVALAGAVVALVFLPARATAPVEEIELDVADVDDDMDAAAAVIEADAASGAAPDDPGELAPVPAT